MNNLQQLMQMGQQLQARITKLQDSLKSQKITASSGGGMVNATVDGKGDVKEIRLDSACIDKDDIEMLEDLIVAAVSQAQAKARQQYEEQMKQAAGGLPMQIPGLF